MPQDRLPSPPGRCLPDCRTLLHRSGLCRLWRYRHTGSTIFSSGFVPGSATNDFFDRVEKYHDRVRTHSTPGYQTPVDFENQLNWNTHVHRLSKVRSWAANFLTLFSTVK